MSSVISSAETMFKAIIFDLDGVLIDACEIHRQCFRKALATFDLGGLSFRDEDLEGRPTQTKLSLLGIEPVLHKMINREKQRLTLEAAKEYPRDERRVEMLTRLQKEFPSIQMACVTNSIRETATTFLEAAGLRKFLVPLISNEDVSSPKPDPEGYVTCMRKLNVPAGKTLIVEDSPVGLQAARRSAAAVLATTFETLSFENISWALKGD